MAEQRKVSKYYVTAWLRSQNGKYGPSYKGGQRQFIVEAKTELDAISEVLSLLEWTAETIPFAKDVFVGNIVWLDQRGFRTSIPKLGHTVQCLGCDGHEYADDGTAAITVDVLSAVGYFVDKDYFYDPLCEHSDSVWDDEDTDYLDIIEDDYDDA